MSVPAIDFLRIEPRIAILQHVEADGTLWGSRGRVLFRSSDGVDWERVTSFPFAFPRDAFGFSRLSARAFRADKANVFVNSAGKVCAIRDGTVYTLESQGKLVPSFRIQGDTVLHGGICEDREGWTTFGEYFMNPERGEVRIWRLSPDMKEHQTAYRFSPGSVRHVHGIYRDPYDADSLWATVGDYAGECYIIRTDDRFEHVEWFGDGGQLWRAVRLFFTEEYVTWLTDSHLEQNYACRMSRADGHVECGMPLPGSGWYGIATLDGWYLAFTTVEPGPAIQRMESLILVSRDGFTWHEAAAFPKDIWRPMKLFKYGVISAPSGEMHANSLWISGEGLVGLDGVSAHIRVVEHDA